MTNGLIFLVAAAMAQASPATTSEAANTQSQDAAVKDTKDKAKDDADRIICKRYAKTGTRVREKVCYTAAQWKQIRNRAQDIGLMIQDRGAIDASRRSDR